MLDKPRRQRQRLGLQRTVADVLALPCPILQRDVHPLAVLRDMPVEQLDQSGEGLRRLFGRGLRHRRRRRRGRFSGAGLRHLAQQVARRFGLGERRLGQADPEFALDAGEQFHPRQAVEAEIALQFMIQAEAVDAVGARPQLARKAADKVEQLRLGGD